MPRAFRFAVTLAIPAALISRTVMRMIVAVVFAGLLACGSTPTEPDRSFSAFALGKELKLFNQGDVTVYYMIVDPARLPVLDYFPCTSRTTCRYVDAHSSVTLDNAAILGHPTALEEVRIIYWRVKVVGGDAVMTEEGQLAVALH